jgi:hypothetical protein
MSQNFPTWSQMAGYYRFFLLTGPILLIFAIVLWARTLIVLRRRLRGVPPQGADRNVGCGAVIALVIAVAHLVGIYGSVINGLRWRIDPNEIAEVRVESFRGHRYDMNQIGKPVTISDRALIREGLSQLTNAVPFHSQHEHFLDGYRIRLKTGHSEDYSERYLALYTRTNRHSGLSMVIPHIGPVDSGTINHAGEYSCEEFHVWFRDHILPIVTKDQEPNDPLN